MNSSSDMNCKAFLVLTVFCGMVGLQAACEAGMWSHCGHPDETFHHEDACPQDHCQDYFSLPIKFATQTVAATGQPWLGLAQKSAPDRLAVALLSDTSRSGTIPAWPGAQFPLLI